MHIRMHCNTIVYYKLLCTFLLREVNRHSKYQCGDGRPAAERDVAQQVCVSYTQYCSTRLVRIIIIIIIAVLCIIIITIIHVV